MDVTGSPRNTGLKITLSIALVITLGSFVFFGLSTRKGDHKETFQLLGGICLVSGSILLFVAALQYIYTGKKVEYLTPSSPVSQKVSKKKGATLVILSADSWCGFSKKMTAEVPALTSLLDPMGIEVVLVSDIQDKPKFQKLAAQHSARGFPHSVLIVDGAKIADIPGYMPALKIQEIVSSKLA